MKAGGVIDPVLPHLPTARHAPPSPGPNWRARGAAERKKTGDALPRWGRGWGRTLPSLGYQFVLGRGSARKIDLAKGEHIAAGEGGSKRRRIPSCGCDPIQKSLESGKREGAAPNTRASLCGLWPVGSAQGGPVAKHPVGQCAATRYTAAEALAAVNVGYDSSRASYPACLPAHVERLCDS